MPRVNFVIGSGCCRLRRGILETNLRAPNKGLGGVPVGTLSAKALGASGLKPFLHTSTPPVVMDAPFDELAPGNLAKRKGSMDFLRLSARFLRLSHPNTG